MTKAVGMEEFSNMRCRSIQNIDLSISRLYALPNSYWELQGEPGYNWDLSSYLTSILQYTGIINATTLNNINKVYIFVSVFKHTSFWRVQQGKGAFCIKMFSCREVEIALIGNGNMFKLWEITSNVISSLLHCNLCHCILRVAI